MNGSIGDPNVPADPRVTALVETRAEPDTGVPPVTFEDFFRAEYRSVARALVIVAGDALGAEDLAQEAFVRAYERWDRVRVMGSPAGYVYRAALNLHRSRLRRAAVALRHRRGTGSPEAAADIGPELQHEVREMLASLPRGQREALMLVEWLGYPAGEAARILGVRPASVRGRIHRARVSMRARFGGNGD
ncbi:MAG: RNA polymerase sigma factor [Actinomycetota bacterium]